MKLPRFDYAVPRSLSEAIALLATHAGDARLIAGGQSLIPLLAFRLAEPKLLVDLRNVPGLEGIALSDDGVRLGARVRWRDIVLHQALARAHPLLTAAVKHIAHYPIRNRGTVGGSLAHADVAAELPGIAITCDARIMAVGPAGSRAIDAAQFFVAPLTTTLAPNEVLTELHLPPWPAGRRWAFEEFARQRGAFALAAIALFYDVHEGYAMNAHIGVIGASALLQRLTEAESVLNGKALDEDLIVRTASVAAASVDVQQQPEVSTAYRRALVATLVDRALRRASARLA